MQGSFSSATHVAPVGSVYILRVAFALGKGPKRITLIRGTTGTLRIGPLFGIVSLLGPYMGVTSLSRFVVVSFSSFLAGVTCHRVNSVCISTQGSVDVSLRLFFLVCTHAFSCI